MKKFNVSNLSILNPDGETITFPHTGSPGFDESRWGEHMRNANPLIFNEAQVLEAKARCLRRIEGYKEILRNLDEVLSNPDRVVK